MLKLTSCVLFGLSLGAIAACSDDATPTGNSSSSSSTGGPTASSSGASTSSSSSGASTSSSSSSGGSSGSSGTLAAAGITATINGDAKTFPTVAAVTINNAAQIPEASRYTAFAANGTAGVMDLSFTGDKVGKFTCGSGNNIKVRYTDTATFANTSLTVCTIDVTTFDAPGGKIAGTFSGTATVKGQPFEIKDGTFSVNRPAQ